MQHDNQLSYCCKLYPFSVNFALSAALLSRVKRGHNLAKRRSMLISCQTTEPIIFYGV